MPRDRGSQSSGNKKQDKENFCGSEIEEDMNMHSHLFRSYNLSKRIESRESKHIKILQ